VLSLAFAQAAGPSVVEPIQVPYLPTTIWVLATGLSLLIILVALGIYLWYRQRVQAVIEDASAVADLAAKKTQLEAEIEQCQNWLKGNKEELLQREAERQEQEIFRKELARLSMELVQNDQRMDELRREASDLQNVVSSLAQDRDRLTVEKATLDREKAELQAAKSAAEATWQRADTEAKRVEQELHSLAERYKEGKERLDRIVQDIATKEVQQQSLDREMAAATERSSALQLELLKLEAERREQEILRKELEELQRELAQQEQRVDDLRSKANDLQHVVSTLTQDQDRLATEKAALERVKAESEAITRAAEECCRKYVTEAEQARQEMQEATQRLHELRRDISEKDIKLQSLMHENTSLATRLSERQQEILAVEKRLNEVRANLTPLEEILTQKRQVQRERDELLEEKRSLKESIASLKQERVGLTADSSSRYADLLETSPECLSEAIFLGGKAANRIEEQVLDELRQNLKAQGLLFSDRILKAFHTSLKVSQISPLTVLAGVSGTGKSILPLEYAKAMGMHSLIVSVQPRWDSPQDLFGFYNYLEHKYKATDLARALVRMDTYNFLSLKGQKRNERMLLVLLDEMNLARIEYYFSEFLSKLEIRRLVTDPSQQDQRAPAEFELETGPRSAEDSIFRLWVGENVLFVGTMNEDESTQTLSDKVLDRANVLRFGRPPEGVVSTRRGTEGATHNGKFLTFSEWQAWIKRPSAGNRWDSDVNSWIASVNAALEQIGRPFGYRVQQAIREYILQYPGVDGGRIYARAFADQVEQKVLPKLRGIDIFANASKEALDTVQGVLAELGDEDLTEAFRKSKDDESTGTFIWRGVTRAV
jgi:peptidoglycan hydrolase CwlO-like protein